jgi:ERF superfamily
VATLPNQPNEVVHHIALKPPSGELASLTPVELLRIAVTQNANIDQLTKLMDLQERWERREAKRAYDAAMKQFKANPPRITKNHHVHFEAKDRAKGPTDYRHSTLDHVCDAITGALARVGIAHRWKIAQNGEWFNVTCILTHELGHSEETTLPGAADNTGNKNSIQAVGSTVTYLQRYTLLAATGLATTDQDDDGRGGKAAEGLSDERMEVLGSAIADSKTLDELKANYFTAYREAEQAKDRTAKTLFMRTKDARKRELR